MKMKTELLRELRETAANKINIYLNKSTNEYLILFNKCVVPRMVEYDGTPSEYFDIIKRCSSRKEAKAFCNLYRRKYILLKIVDIRNKEHRW